MTSTTAWLFPGQGFDEPGMGLSLLERSARAQRAIDCTSEVTHTDIRALLERGGPALARTNILQPVLVALSLSWAHDELARDPEVLPRFVAGHSLGDLTAWCFAAGLSIEHAVSLAAVRGAAMENAARALSGSMLALTQPLDAVQSFLHSQPAWRALCVAAVNAPDEVVLSGDRALLQQVQRLHGGQFLPVAGPWHSTEMEPAAGAVRDALSSCVLHPRDGVVWCSAVTGTITDMAEGPERLVRALTSPVVFRSVLGSLLTEGVSTVVCVPPGRLMRGLVRRNLGTSLTVRVGA